MPYDLTGRSLTPLSEMISSADFPLADYLPVDDFAALFEGIYVADPQVWVDDPDLIIDCHLAIPSELSLSLPGSDSYALVLGSAGPGWTAVHATLSVGPDPSLTLTDLTLGLRFDPDVLRDPATGNGASIEIACTLRVSPEGIVITDTTGLSLAKSALCGTDILVEAADVRLVFDGDDLPAFLVAQPDFRGVAFERLTVSIPSEYLALDPGATLDVAIENAAIGNTGFTGQTSFQAAPGVPITGRFAGFVCRLRELGLDVVENSLIKAAVALDVRLEALEQGATEKWVALDVAFGQGGGFSAQAAAIQPPTSSSDPNALVTVDYPDAVTLALKTLRLTRETAGGVDRWAVYFSGDAQVLIPGASWPKIGFDGLGVSSDGQLLLPEGGGITFESPLVVEFYFVRLTVPKFRFGRPEGSDVELQVQLSAEVDLIEGLPAGASIEGLTITWDPRTNDAPAVSFSGIGLEFGVPGSFSAGIELAFLQHGASVEFRGQGHLELSSLDMGIQIGVIVGYDQPQDFAYLYLFADAKLLPTGIPIGQSGLAIFGFQGLIAYNMALALDMSAPVDERYYTLFVTPPIGITDIGKWRKQKGQNALGIGVVLGTVDKGFSFNVKGLFTIAFPDIVLLLQAKANILRLKPDLSTESEGTLDALLVLDTMENTFTFDVIARWGMPSIVEVSGSARAFFDFDDPLAFYVQIGRDQEGKRVSANVIRWGNGWLFAAGFWFEVNGSSVVTGVLVEVGLRYEAGGFWIEATGTARGEMKLFWEPAQWEGSIALSGRIGAGYRGLSLSVQLGGDARVRVSRPLAIELRAEACFEALFWSICKGHTFRWERLDPPLLERPLRALTAAPRNWTLKVEQVPVAGSAGPAQADDGRVRLNEGAAPLRKVQPHSAISIDFAKPMVDATGRFNEAVPLPDDGFLTIGDESGYSASYELVNLRLVRDPDGEPEAIDLWGAWALETPQYNTTLRLLSSARFGHDGSLTESFSDGVKLDYCAEPKDREVCIPLAGLEPGYGWIDGRLPYQWDTTKSKFPGKDRRNDHFIELLPGDRFTVFVPEGFTDAHFQWRQCPPRRKEDTDPKRKVGKASSKSRSLLARLRERFFARPARKEADVQSTPGKPRADGGVTIEIDDEPICVFALCYHPGHAPAEYVTGTRRGGSVTHKDDWSVPDDARILQPGATYELTVELKTRLRHPNGNKVEQANAQKVWKTRFTVDGPPIYPLALTDYVAATYPSSGARPTYTGYDLVVRFHSDYVPFLYKAAQQQLCIRLFDGQGNPVTDAQGNPVLIPASRLGVPDRSVSEQWWEREYRLNVTRGCIAADLGKREGQTTLAVEAGGIVLTPNSQYRAELVSDAAITVPLFVWSFTTSSFATFTALVTDGRVVKRPQTVTGPASGNDFEALARQLAIPTVAYVVQTTVTPLVSLDRTRCLAMLIESLEPLDAGTRLTIKVDGAAAEVIRNVDGTRLFVRTPSSGGWPVGAHAVRLDWSRGAVTDPAELQRAVAGVLGTETVEVAVMSGGL